MKKMFFTILLVLSMPLMYVSADTEVVNEEIVEEIKEVVEPETKETVIPEIKYVASINDVMYETFDEAVTAAVDGDTIKLLDNATTKGLNLSKNLTIDGSKEYTLTFEDKGIALWGVSLTFKDVTVNIKGIGSTPYTAEWNWMTISASKNATLNLENAKLTLDGTGTKSNVHAIYFGSNNKLNLNNSTLIIKNYTQDALEWDGGDGGYNVNLVNSTFISDNNRSGFTGTFYATIDNSTVKVLNSKGNGSNGTYYTIKNNSNVLFDNSGNWGISAWRIDMTNNSTLTATNNGYSGIWTRVLNVDSSCTLIANSNGTKAFSAATNAGIFFQGNGTYTSTIEKGAKVEIKNNAGSGIYTKQNICNLTILAGEITNNGTGTVNKSKIGASLGGGIYNVGTLIIGEDVNIYNNHAEVAGDDIYNGEKGIIDFKDVKDNWILDDCNDKINNWYDDSKDNRWNAHADKEEELHVDAVKSGKYETGFSIKAAHNLKAKVIARYVDEDGKVIAEEETINGYVNDNYKTVLKDIYGYELKRIEGNTTGNMTIKDITVTYVYEYVMGEGGDDVPVVPEKPETPNIPYTGIEEKSDITSLTGISALSLMYMIIVRKRGLI